MTKQTRTSPTVSMVGLGSKGFAFAEAMVTAGHRTTVWNRSSTKAAPLAIAGAVIAESVSEAVSASDVIMVCVRRHDVVNELLRDPEVASALGGRLSFNSAMASRRR
ncbi:MAG: NAD(P)-binding domain-containing protein [Acidimicrobiales bacterium]|jgi:3-hydroxyisobutyrate dehydrogenase-like beta-hydroxyacid dehydrogenase